jgi:hypothetical protein
MVLACAPKGIRTPVLALRGPRPGPLDDGGNSAQILPPHTSLVNSVRYNSALAKQLFWLFKKPLIFKDQEV